MDLLKITNYNRIVYLGQYAVMKIIMSFWLDTKTVLLRCMILDYNNFNKFIMES